MATIEHEPMTVCSRGRLYTDSDQRQRLDIVGTGHGESVTVGVVVVDRNAEWGVASRSVSFATELGYYGEIQLPSEVRDYLGVEIGDHVRVTVSQS